MITQSSNHIGFVIRSYLAAIYLGLFLATSIIPHGYMPLVNHEGSVQFVACLDTGKTVPTKSHTIESTYDCPFSLLQLSILLFPGPIPFPAGNSFFELLLLFLQPSRTEVQDNSSTRATPNLLNDNQYHLLRRDA